MFVVMMAQNAATSGAYASRHSEQFSEDGDLLGLCMSNIGAGLSEAFVGNGSPTKTQIVECAGVGVRPLSVDSANWPKFLLQFSSRCP